MGNQSAPAHSTPANDLRNEPRCRLRLPVDAFIDGREVHRGFVMDISLLGATLYLDRNLQKSHSIKLHIRVPPLVALNKPHIVKVTGTIVYSIYDSRELSFRCGISFLKFASQADQDFLQARLFRN